MAYHGVCRGAVEGVADCCAEAGASESWHGCGHGKCDCVFNGNMYEQLNVR